MLYIFLSVSGAEMKMAEGVELTMVYVRNLNVPDTQTYEDQYSNSLAAHADLTSIKSKQYKLFEVD